MHSNSFTGSISENMWPLSKLLSQSCVSAPISQVAVWPLVYSVSEETQAAPVLKPFPLRGLASFQRQDPPSLVNLY